MSYLVLACTGLDRPEGSVAREVAIRLAEEAGAFIICPVALNRTPARYKKMLSDGPLVVVDGCATQCAGKLAGAAGAKPVHKVLVADIAKQTGTSLGPGLRLAPDAIELARKIVDEIKRVGSPPAEKVAVPGQAAEVAGFPPPSDFVVVLHDKYEFRIPVTGFLFNENDVWVQVSGSHARVGISDYMQQRLTDITYVDAPAIGTEIEQFGEAGTVESTKATFEIVSPVAGTVAAINVAIAEEPERINEDPYGSWVVELELTAWDEDRTLLIDGAAYAAHVERKAAED